MKKRKKKSNRQQRTHPQPGEECRGREEVTVWCVGGIPGLGGQRSLWKSHNFLWSNPFSLF